MCLSQKGIYQCGHCMSCGSVWLFLIAIATCLVGVISSQEELFVNIDNFLATQNEGEAKDDEKMVQSAVILFATLGALLALISSYCGCFVSKNKNLCCLYLFSLLTFVFFVTLLVFSTIMIV